MHLSNKSFITFALVVFGVLSSSALMSANTDEVQEHVAKILDAAIEDGELFELDDGQKVKHSNFYAFYYSVPKQFRGEHEAYFIKCVNNTVRAHNLVGPQRRPLALIPKSPLPAKKKIQKQSTGRRNNQPHALGRNTNFNRRDFAH